jgi:hypothetical protein
VVTLAERKFGVPSPTAGITSPWLDGFNRQYLYGAICCAAVGPDTSELLAVFLADSTAERPLCPGPVLLNDEVSCPMRHTIQEIGPQAFAHLAKLLGLRLGLKHRLRFLTLITSFDGESTPQSKKNGD